MHGPPNVKFTHYPLDRRLGRPKIWYKHCREQNSLLRLFGINSQSLSYSPIVWYSSITSINSLSFCTTTFSVSPTKWTEKYRLPATIFIIVATV